MIKDMVSVIIPNYNRSKILNKTVQSVLKQTYKNIEIIIVDDKSSDDSKELIINLSQKYRNITYYFNQENKGANYCRNKGVKLSRGEYVAFLDSDDEFLPTKIEKQINVFKGNNNLGIVFSNMLIGEKDMKILEKDRLVNIEDILFRNTLGGFSSVMLKRSVFSKVGVLDEKLLSCQDWEFYLRVLEQYDGYLISEPLVLYYLQPDSISKNLDKVLQGHKVVFQRISQMNKKNKMTSANLLYHHQNLLLGDIYRNFNKFKNAREHYWKSLLYKYSVESVSLIFLTFGGKYSNNALRRLKSMI